MITGRLISQLLRRTSMVVSGIFDRGQLVIEPWLDDPMPDYDCGL